MTKIIQSHLPRRQLQRAFIQWLATNRQRLCVPVGISKRNDSLIEIRLHGINTAIHVGISESKTRRRSKYLIRNDYVRRFPTGFPAGSHEHAFEEITVSVDYAGTFWDFLCCIELMEIHQPDGYSCGLCDPDYRELYATRAELWEGKLFDPFAKWLNEILHPSNWLVLKQIGGCTWAELIYATPEAESIAEESIVARCLPIRN